MEYQMMRQNIFENRKRQTPKMTFVFVLKPRMIVLGFYVLEKWIKGFFVSDGSSRSVPWIDIVVWESKELGLDTMKELFHTTSWQICSTNGFSEKGITR